MSNLVSRLKSALEFDEKRSKEDCSRRIEAFGDGANLFALHVEAARFEHNYLREIHARLIECIEALELINHDPTSEVNTALHQSLVAYNTLIKLERVLKDTNHEP